MNRAEEAVRKRQERLVTDTNRADSADGNGGKRPKARRGSQVNLYRVRFQEGAGDHRPWDTT